MHIYIYTYCETSILAPSARKHARKMQPVAAQSALYRRQNAYTMDHGPTIKATNLEAHFSLVAPFLVQNLARVLGPQNTNRSYSIRAASVLLPPQADSSTYP